MCQEPEQRRLKLLFAMGNDGEGLVRELCAGVKGESVIVKSDISVLFRNEETSLTIATMIIFDNGYYVAPVPYWVYNRKLLKSIYNETYPTSLE